MDKVSLIREKVVGWVDALALTTARLAEAVGPADEDVAAELHRIHVIITATRRVILEEEP